MQDKSGGKKNGIATALYIVAIVLTIFWIAIIIDEIQTGEAWLGAPIGATLMPNWLVLAQPVELVAGTLDANMVGPVIITWVAEIFVVAMPLFFEVTMIHIKKYNARLVKAFGTACVLSIAFDGWTNYCSHFAGGDFLHQAAFVLGLAAGAILFPVLALAAFKVAQMES